MNIFSPSGHINRPQYLLVFLSVLIVSIVLFVFSTYVQYSWLAVLILGLIIFLGVLSIFAGIKRLRDIGKSGWWCLIMLIPIANILLLLFLLFKRGISDSANLEPNLPPENTVSPPNAP